MTTLSSLLAWVNGFFLPFGVTGLFLLSFLEGFILPLPPDLLLIALTLAKPSAAFWYAGIATLGSLLGGLLGYWLGAHAGRPLLERVVRSRQIDYLHRKIRQYDAAAIFIAGFSPLPYNVFAIGGGVLRMDMGKFLVATAFSRGPRFFLIALLLFFWGGSILAFIVRFFNLITLAVGGLIFLAVIWYYGKKEYRRRKALR